MYKVYLKQALHILKEGKLISIISITGTALAITMVSLLLVLYSREKHLINFNLVNGELVSLQD